MKHYNFEVEVKDVLEEIQEEWDEREDFHRSRYQKYGIRSSQISALVAYLIKNGIIK